MNRRKAPSVLIYSDDATRKEVEDALGRLKAETATVSSLAAIGGRLKERFVNVAIIDACSGSPKIPEALSAIKSASPETEIILLVPGGKTFESPEPRNLVYASLEKPINKNFLSTITSKALEKQSLSKAAAPSAGAQAGSIAGGNPLLSSSVNSLNSAVTITDMSLKIIYVNPAHVRTFGYAPEELMGKNNSVLYPSDDPSGVSGKIYEALLMVGWEGERLALRKDGSAFQAYEKTSVIKDASGKQVGIVSIIDDITSRKRLQQALKESEERYRSFVETARSAIIAVEGDGKITLFNPAAEKIFGYSAEEMINSQFSSLFPAGQKDALRLELGKGSGVTALRGTTAELTALNKHGEEFPIDVSFSTCRVDGRPITTAIIFDITERKSLQEQLLQSAKLAAIGELISGVTHEVNNPLAVVIGYSEMLLSESEMNAESKEAVRSIHGEAERAKKVIQNLLSFARKHSPKKEVIQVNDILEKTLGLTDYERRKNGVKIMRDLDPDLPETVGDPNQLQQVFLNIIINAQHAMMDMPDERRITVRTRLKEKPGVSSAGTPSVIEIAFEDNGPGIPENVVKKIFDPFYTTKPKGKGTGLGLSVSFGIIRDHGGTIQVKPNEERGVTFYIEIPA